MTDKQAVLKKRFGYPSFRDGQEQVIDSLLSRRDVLCVMPTGAGKSVCYQVPALMLPGVTLVISPLISLMKDQVMSLVQNSIAAAYINSSLTLPQYGKALFNARNGKYKIIYVAPERLAAAGFLEAFRDIDISLVAVDEAHCISQWGQDFRPSYLKIADFIDSLPHRPVVGAFTATATEAVKSDIERFLKLRNPLKIATGFDRPNLFFSIMKPASKFAELRSLIGERKGKAGIVYCSTRKNVEEICNLLNREGFSVTRYHAGLTDSERKKNQEDFICDRKQIMIATNAFGMGIDRSDVSFVIHYNMPKDLESYYQEAGRAGRDGEKADCILLYSPGDFYTNKFLIENTADNPDLSEEERGQVRQKDLEKLRQMTFYATSNECLRAFILRYFGEKASNYCGNCSNCKTQFDTVDVTVEAQKILSCIIRTGGRFGKKTVCDILRGSKNEKLLRFGLDAQTTYGIMSDCTEQRIRDIMDYLEVSGCLTTVGSKYPIIAATAKAFEVLREKTSLSMKMAKPKPAARRRARNAGNDVYDDGKIDIALFVKLKALRKTIAESRRVPPYIVFTDASLIDMCRKRPTTPEEFLDVSGVGNAKAEMYSEKFTDAIKKFYGDECLPGTEGQFAPDKPTNTGLDGTS